jgi:peptidoglycan/xylan/chitin deacetylase (PgdA/CDA1 family)
MPQAWKDALSAAVAAGKIPNIPVPSSINSNVVYPTGVNGLSPEICSAYYKCRAAGDMWDAPTGKIGIGFDDGPSLGSTQLYDFLAANNQKATHFMIGINILNNPQLFLRAFNDLQDDIAMHTWTHRYTSTLANEDIVAEFGWALEIIHNSTGGRVPRYWRPPYGDMDNRVRAIAKEIFGLETILWNQDTSDWSLTTGGTTPQAINASMTKWLTGPKSPGLIILEHELTTQAATAFQSAYPLMQSQGWQLESVALFNGTSVYLNSDDDTSPVDEVNDVLATNDSPPASSTSSSSTHTSSTPGSSPSSAGGSSQSNGAVNIASPKGAVASLAGALLVAFFASTIR